MASKLADRKCVPSRKGTLPLEPEAVAPLINELGGGWLLVGGTRLEKEFKFNNFARALIFVNKVAVVAESDGHHPDIFLSWGKVRLSLWTHVASGLTENDFIIAAKADRAYDEMERSYSRS